jgi:hypothetical protein
VDKEGIERREGEILSKFANRRLCFLEDRMLLIAMKLFANSKLSGGFYSKISVIFRALVFLIIADKKS